MITRSKSRKLPQAREQKAKMVRLTSCYECHMRWVACDRGTPCGQCVNHGRVCKYVKTMVNGKERYLTADNRTREGKVLVPDAPTAAPQVAVHPVAVPSAASHAASPPQAPPRARAYTAARLAAIRSHGRVSGPTGSSAQYQQQQQQQKQIKKTPALTGCRACHLRSVKCDGGRPCLSCSHSKLACTYDKTVVKGEPMYLRDDGRTRYGDLVVPDYDPSLPTAPLHLWRSASGAHSANFGVSVDSFPFSDTYQDEDEEEEQGEEEAEDEEDGGDRRQPAGRYGQS